MGFSMLDFSAIFVGGFVVVVGVVLAVSCCLLKRRLKRRQIKHVAGDDEVAAGGAAADVVAASTPWPDLVPTDNQVAQSPEGDGPPPPLPMSVMLAAYSCHEQIKSHHAHSDEVALLCLLSTIDATLEGANGAPHENSMHPGLVEAMHAFGGCGQAQVRAQLELLRRSVHAHLAAARLAKRRAVSGDTAVSWSDASNLERHPGKRPGAAGASRRGERVLAARGVCSPRGARVAGCRPSALPAPSKAIQKLASTMFSKYDTDGSGLIDAHELSALCSELGRDLSPPQLALAMKTLDTSGEGMIDRGEFLWWYALGLSVAALTDPKEQERLQANRVAGLTQMDEMRSRAESTAQSPERMQAVFSRYDKDGSGGLCVAEISSAVRFMGLVVSSGKASELIRRAEHAHEADGHVDYAEFERLVLAIHHEQVQHGGAGLTGRERSLQNERDETAMTDQIPGEETESEAKRALLQIKGHERGATSTRSGHKEKPESTRGRRGGGSAFAQGKIDVAACRPAASTRGGAGSSTLGAAMPKKLSAAPRNSNVLRV